MSNEYNGLAERLVAEYTHKYGLTDWDIFLRVRPRHLIEDKADGYTSGDWRYHTAHIDVAKGLPGYRLHHVVAHEMAHVLLMSLYGLFVRMTERVSEGERGWLVGLYDDELERTCERLARGMSREEEDGDETLSSGRDGEDGEGGAGAQSREQEPV